jgi:hypothetical protein
VAQSQGGQAVSDTPRTDASYGIYELQKTAYDLEIQLNAANERIKRLEEGGDKAILNSYLPDRLAVWNKAKDAKL